MISIPALELLYKKFYKPHVDKSTPNVLVIKRGVDTNKKSRIFLFVGRKQDNYTYTEFFDMKVDIGKGLNIDVNNNNVLIHRDGNKEISLKINRKTFSFKTYNVQG